MNTSYLYQIISGRLSARTNPAFSLRGRCKFLHGTLLLFLTISLASCKKEHCFDCFKSTGKIVTEERSLEHFSSIHVSGQIHVLIKQESMNKAIVEAGQNLLNGIATRVEDGVLYIENNNKCNWVRSFKKDINITLYCKELAMITYTGAGTIRSSGTIVSDVLELDYWSGSGEVILDVQCSRVLVHMHTGPADAEISGTTDYAYFYTRGNGQARCRGLVSKKVEIDWKGTNDCWVHCTEELFANIGYIGNVYYAGNPPVIQAVITERGQLIPLE
jgi:hypothetical protein